ncbi:phenylacetic acid degradation PaaB family protein [Halopenitus sp. POP-27]|uniref:phenylacetic acid degradation PaaB family protein n=1 Tax=Halopenitus sp. POP-27 TaxID=2994425 RepID=UPI00246938BB|nr:phenylacetic acid degradation PaaB family protein [Halopenitus sp. POP-27]
MTRHYEVFARINQGDETLNIGNVQADSDRLAKLYAHNTFDEEDWDFLAVVRREDVHEVNIEQEVLSPA